MNYGLAVSVLVPSSLSLGLFLRRAHRPSRVI